MKGLHICKFKASGASRLAMQRGWDNGAVMDIDPASDHRLGYGELWRVIREGRYGVMVFHMQSSLPYFFFAWFARALFGKSLRLVYDIHDVNERPQLLASYMGFRFLCFYMLEWFAVRMADALLTVSRGLARVYYRRYRRSVRVVRNIPEGIGAGSLPAERSGPLVYFGLINRVRLPGYLFEALELAGCCLHVYGRVDDLDPAFPAWLAAAEARGIICLHGPYAPDALEFLDGYSRSLMIFEEGQVNIRYCLPNKFYQSTALGLGCLVSGNLKELRLTYGDLERFVEVAPNDPQALAELLRRPAAQPDWAAVFARMLDEREAGRVVYLSALGMSGEAPASA